MKASEFFDEFEKDDPEFAQAWEDATPARIMAGLIVRLRQMRDMKQSELAAAAGMEQSAISRVENASNTPSWETVTRLLFALEVEMHIGRVEDNCVLLPREALVAREKAAFQAGIVHGLTVVAPNKNLAAPMFKSSLIKIDEADDFHTPYTSDSTACV